MLSEEVGQTDVKKETTGTGLLPLHVEMHESLYSIIEVTYLRGYILSPLSSPGQ